MRVCDGAGDREGREPDVVVGAPARREPPPEERQFGIAVCQLLPPPVPARYELLDASERDWRGRACLVMWLTGMSSASAWRLALSEDPAWAEHLRDYLPRLAPEPLVVPVIRRRLAAAEERERRGSRDSRVSLGRDPRSLGDGLSGRLDTKPLAR